MSVSKERIRKILVFILVLILCATAVSALVACNPTDNTNTVTFVSWEFEDGTRTTVIQNIENNRVNRPSDPEHEGYSFQYWMKEGENTPFDFETEVYESITLIAKWEPIAEEFDVTFVFDNGDDNIVRSTVGGKAVPVNDPVKANYNFAFWALEGENTPFDFETVLTEDITLVAKWTEKSNTITVTYVYDNGTENLVRNVVGGKVVQIRDPQKDEFEFEYWALEGQDTPFDFNTTITESIVLVAKWKPASKDITRINWNSNDSGASFIFDGETPTVVNIGDTVTFKLRISPYYTGTPSVMAGTLPVTCDNNGVYSFEVTEEVTVTVSGLQIDNTPIRGRGTAFDPYIITTPAQLRTVTSGVNNINSTTYNTAYIKLGADIDLDGETIDPIGVDLYYNMMFGGDFDGDGHTIRNFAISDSYNVVGLFGYTNEAYIANLNVVTDIETEAVSNGLFVGGVVAYNFGSDVVNCSYNGTITVANAVNDSTVSIIAGGIVGFMQGTGSTSSDSYSATVSYSYANAQMHVTGSYEITSIGGIVGAMSGQGALATTNVFNCTANVTMDGYASRAGGIVGWMRLLGAVDNCYAVGTVGTRGVSSEPTKGGIVGEAFNESSVTYCLSAMTVTGSIGGRGVIGLIRPAGYFNVDDRVTVTINNVYAESDTVTVGSRTYDVSSLSDVTAMMDWNASEWKTDDGVILPNEDGINSVAMNITFKFGAAYNGTSEVTLAEMAADSSSIYGYIPLSYVFDGDGFNTLTADDGKISFGFFLDEELTQRVSASFLLTGHATTIYVGFADYSPIAGEYYTVVGDIDVMLTFDDNGMMTMYTDGKRAYYMYVFDGKKLVIHDSYFLYLYYEYLDRTPQGSAYMDVYADITATGLKIYDDTIFNDAGSVSTSLTAIRNNGLLGVWYTSGQTTTYTFNADGTGYVSDGNQFTYTLNVRTVRIMMAGTTISARLSDDGRTMQTTGGTTLSITKYDDFNGTWESSYNDCTVVTFDGVSTATVGGNVYTYYIEDGVLISEGMRAYFNSDKLLILELDGKTLTMGREGSFIGTWKDTGLNYQFILFGINSDGYGLGYDSYGYDFTYICENGELSMYYRTSFYGFGNVHTATVGDMESTLLELAMFTPSSGTMVDDYNMSYVDIFEGTWNSENGITLAFNGNGAYNINVTTSDMVWDVRGFVTVTENGQSSVVRYVYDRDSATATFEYNDKQCVARASDGGITVLIGDVEVDFAEPDSLGSYDWYTAGIERISFDGRGNAGGGTVTFTVDGINTEYGYSYVNDTEVVILANETLVYTIDLTTMTLKDADGESVGILGVYNAVLGKVYTVNGTNGTFELDCSEPLDSEGVAYGQWATMQVRFVYLSETTLAVYNGYSSGAMFYLVYVDENTVVIANATSSGTLEAYSVAFVPDELLGIYYNADKSVRLTIDGSSRNSYMLSSADFCEIDENGEQIADEDSYTYFENNGVWGIYSYERVGEEFEYTLVYTISLQEVDGATAFSTENGSKTIWIKEA